MNILRPCIVTIVFFLAAPRVAACEHEKIACLDRIVALCDLNPSYQEKYGEDYNLLKNYSENKDQLGYILQRATAFLEEYHMCVESDEELCALAQDIADHIRVLEDPTRAPSTRFISTPTSITPPCALSLGQFSFATGCTSAAIGYAALASEAGSSAFGLNASATGINAGAFGAGSNASGYAALAFGTGARASNTGSVAIGTSASAIGVSSFAIGNGANNPINNSMLFYSPTGVGGGGSGNFYMLPLPPSSAGTALGIQANGLIVQQSSSRRYKEDIQPMDVASENINKLEPVTFNFKNDTEKKRSYGLIAEDVEKLLPGLVTYNAEGMVQGVKYSELTAILLRELQKHQIKLASLEEQIAALQQEIDRVKKK